MEHQNARLALTYANDRFQDGAGAQLLRIYGIYALSRFLRVSYIHSPIAHVGYQGLLALENNGSLADPVEEYRRVFHIPSDLALPEQPVIHELQDAHIGEIARIRDAGNQNGRFHLIRIVCPYTVTDRYPEIYRCVRAISPFTYSRSEVFRLAIHVRRGELFVVDGDRMFPNSYYVSQALRFQALLTELDIPFVCELYTEAPTRKFEVTPQHHGMEGRIERSTTIDPAMNHLEDFDEIPRLDRFINTDPIESLCRMATADALILSRSCFSHVAALLSPNGIAVGYPGCHTPLKEWLVSDEGGLPEKSLFERLKAWKRAAETGSSFSDSVYGAGSRRGAKAPLADFVTEQRETIAGIAAGHGATHVRVIGSVARGTARFDDEIDLLALWPEGNRRLSPAALAADLESALGRPVGIAVHDGSEASEVTAFYRDIVCPRILRTEPVGWTDDTTCEVHAQVGCNDWLDLIWSLKSFYRFSGRRYAMCLHDDGTVPEYGLEQLRRHFPSVRVISRKEADARAQVDLRDFPRCMEFRGRHAMGPRIFDFPAFSRSERVLWFDGGLLFFAEPTALLERIENAEYGRNAFPAACDDSDEAAAKLPPFHNGLGLVQRGSLPADWCEELLAESVATDGRDGADEERALLALCSCRFGADLLPAEYALHSDPGIANRPVHRYGPFSRSFRYSEGIATLMQRNFLPWKFAVLLESERLV